jgi:hypothetical protein
MRLTLLLALLFLTRLSFAQTNAAPAPTSAPPSQPAPAKPPHAPATAAEWQAALDQLTQSNRDLLDLLKKQQAVLEDMQYDRRLQSRQIESLEQRLEDALFQNTQLQRKIATLEAAAVRPAASTPMATAVSPSGSTNPTPGQPTPTPVAVAPPPSTYLPPPDPQGALGTKSWHRLFTLKGDGSKQTDLFHIQGRAWRVLWHNQDQPGPAFVNTSGLFINAFPKDDTIPQRVCSKVGSGSGKSELDGPGNYYLKIEASGGSWELAVEDYR